MQLDIDIFNQVKSGPAFISSATGKISAAGTKLSSASSAFSNPALSVLDTNIANQVQSALDGAAISQLNFSNHIDDQLTNAVDRLNISKSAKQIDAFVDQVPESCVNTDALLGSVTGVADSYIDDLAGYADDMVASINDYLASNIDLTQLEAALSAITANINAAVGWLNNKLSQESALLAEMEAALKNFADSLGIQQLWDDPCAQAVMDQLLPTDIKNLLP